MLVVTVNDDDKPEGVGGGFIDFGEVGGDGEAGINRELLAKL